MSVTIWYVDTRAHWIWSKHFPSFHNQSLLARIFSTFYKFYQHLSVCATKTIRWVRPAMRLLFVYPVHFLYFDILYKLLVKPFGTSLNHFFSFFFISVFPTSIQSSIILLTVTLPNPRTSVCHTRSSPVLVHHLYPWVYRDVNKLALSIPLMLYNTADPYPHRLIFSAETTITLFGTANCCSYALYPISSGWPLSCHPWLCQFSRLRPWGGGRLWWHVFFIGIHRVLLPTGSLHARYSDPFTIRVKS